MYTWKKAESWLGRTDLVIDFTYKTTQFGI
jgi:hypothetical protein